MVAVITERCVGTCDTACVNVCPVDCIVGPVPLDEIQAVPLEERGQRFPKLQLFVNPEECIHCGGCIPACPVNAIFYEDEVPEADHHSIEANAAFFRR